MALSLVESGVLARQEENLLRGRDMLCFSHDWDSDPLSKTHLMRLLSRENRILWVNSIGYRAPTVSRRDLGRVWKKLSRAAEPIREVLPNLFVLNPLVLPWWGQSWARSFNGWILAWQVSRAMRKLRFHQPINWVFNPSAAIVAGKLGESQVIYYCVDEYSAFAGVSRRAVLQMEKKLLQSADLVIASSERLLHSKRGLRPEVVLVRHGVDFEHFRTALSTQTTQAPELRDLPRPILGYFGLMSADWVDVGLLKQVAERFPQGSLVLIGKVAMDLESLKSMPQVHLLGHKPYAELPGYCKAFDVGLIPFPINETTLNSNPLKAREYLAAGLPVVSTAIPEVQSLGLCGIARDSAEFISKIEQALNDPSAREDRSDTMRNQTWEARLEEIRAHLRRIS
jgi:glycosyltransferase involved in cell wall biosynthesis